MSIQGRINIKMLYFDTIDVSEAVDVNQACSPKECDICQYWCFLNFQLNVCNRCHYLLMISINFSVIDILNVKNSHYCCIIIAVLLFN